MDGFAFFLSSIFFLFIIALFIVHGGCGFPRQWQNNWGILAVMIGIPLFFMVIAVPQILFGALVLLPFLAGNSSRRR